MSVPGSCWVPPWLTGRRDERSRSEAFEVPTLVVMYDDALMQSRCCCDPTRS